MSIPTSTSKTVVDSRPDTSSPRHHVPYYYTNLAFDWLEARTGLRQALRHIDAIATRDSAEAEARAWVQDRLEAALHVLEEKWPVDMRQAYDEDHARFEADMQRKQRSDARSVSTRRRRATQHAAAD